MRPIVVLGDRTSHGGTVIQASIVTATDGLGWARIGDMVACPRCKGVYPIVEGDESLLDDGRAVAYDGCKVACGAALIAGRQIRSVLTPSGGAVAATLAASYADEPVSPASLMYRGRFRLLDIATGEPIPGRDVRVSTTSGWELLCQTDAEGYTPWIERDAAEYLQFTLVDNQGEA